MFARFSDQVRQVLVLAQEEARLLSHDFMGTEHMLLGLLREVEVGRPPSTCGLSYLVSIRIEKVALDGIEETGDRDHDHSD
jgi:ATP-dependent Clp protease ATP-binding subunit ClpA